MIEIQKNILLAPYTTFRIGGLAKFFVEVESGEELMEAIEFANEKDLDFFVLGGGSNILFSDNGFSGLVIKINSKLFVVHDISIGCGVGWSLAKIVKEVAARELSGMEWAFGIPGTIGGAIRGNAGAFGGEIANSVQTVNYVDVDDLYEELGGKKVAKIKTFQNEECGFSYRNSIFKQNNNLIILSASFGFKKSNKIEIEKTMQIILEKRKTNYSGRFGNAGSFFINPIVNKSELIVEFEKETGTKSQNQKIPAGWIIDQAGLRGKKMGGAMVSQEHANFILNTGNATAEDVIILASFIKQQVRDQFGIELQEEIRYVGF
jgi:UDP-N-acetylmuramate dehydrogenase